MKEEFYKNIKSKKTLLIVGMCIFIVCMVIGFLIYFAESNAEYQDFTKNIESGTYAKIDVQMLESSFAWETTDYDKKNYYIAYDKNEYPYIVVLDDKTLEKLKNIQEYTLSVSEEEKPEPVTIYGCASKTDTEIYRYLQELLANDDGDTYSIDTIKNLFGDTYLDTYIQNDENAMYGLIVFAIFSIIGLCLIIIYFVRNKNTKKILNEYSDEFEKVENEIETGKGIHNKTCGVYLTDKYLISYLRGLKFIELKDIVWVYTMIMKQNGITSNKSIYVITNDGKSNVIANISAWGKKKNSEFEELYQDIMIKAPNALFGFTAENKAKAKEMYKK